MAPVLQCPDCGTKHPLKEVPPVSSFACQGCGRALKVPEQVRQARQTQTVGAGASAVTAPPAPPVAPRTEMLPAVERNPQPPAAPPPQPIARSRKPVPRLAPVPIWMRFLLWVAAVPLSFLIVFVAARALGMFTSDQLSDLFLADESSRFWPVARLLPFVALLCAVLVQGGVYFLARLRGRRRTTPAASA
jgi:hypothetical protein